MSPQGNRLAKMDGFTGLDGPRPDAWRFVFAGMDAGKPPDTTGWR
jgi:hypothetical protein